MYWVTHMKNATILILFVAVAFLADRAVRPDNQRYAMDIRMCEVPLVPGVDRQHWDFGCLDKVQTRISWLAQLLVVFTDPAPQVELWSP